ncbi:hypothetical protein [Corynebacterium cystitidis]|uniref:hypothetical protein n=1 Tax=Corynebacterium cystitidis TaxID=35757 RepID=UPI00211DA84F|nr:hypothetical protein [Corynebacterium cystitidis]
MPSEALFEPSFLLEMDFADCDFSVFEDDPAFNVEWVRSQGVDYLLIDSDVAVGGLFLDTRWVVVDGIVRELTIRWDNTLDQLQRLKIDGVDASDPYRFVEQWNKQYEGKLRVYGGDQIWNEDKSVGFLYCSERLGAGQFRLPHLKYFHPSHLSHKRDPEYFVLGDYDAPQNIERFLDQCLWGDLLRQWPVDLDGWLRRWPGINQRWPDLQSDPGQWLEALDAVIGYVFADGRFEVYDLNTDESITSLERFQEVTAPYRESGNISNLESCFFIFVAALELRP